MRLDGPRDYRVGMGNFGPGGPLSEFSSNKLIKVKNARLETLQDSGSLAL